MVAALENAQLFDQVLRLKNYNEGILKSLTNGVVTFDSTGVITKANEAAGRILATDQEALFGRPAQAVFGPRIVKSLDNVTRTGNEDFHPDVDLLRGDDSMGQVIDADLEAVQHAQAGMRSRGFDEPCIGKADAFIAQMHETLGAWLEGET